MTLPTRIPHSAPPVSLPGSPLPHSKEGSMSPHSSSSQRNYVCFEDYQKDLSKYIHAQSVSGDTPPLPSRRFSEPAGGTEEATASDIAKIGGFRRAYLHSQTGNAEGSICASEEETTLVEDIDSHLAQLMDFFKGTDWETRQGLFDDRTDAERRRQEGLPPAKARPGISYMKTCLSIYKSFIGTSILLLPYCFASAGYLISTLFIVLAGAISTVGILKLVTCAEKCKLSYSGLATRAFGKNGGQMVSVSLAFSHFMFGCCLVFFMCSTFGALVEGTKGDGGEGNMFFVGGGVVLLLLIPLGFIRKIGNMQSTVLFSNCCILLGIGYVLTKAIIQIYEQGGSPAHGAVPVKEGDGNLVSILSFLGTSIYMFEGIGLALPIRSAMAEPEHYRSALYLSMSLVTFSLCFVGFVGYYAWGPSVETVSLNQGGGGWLQITIQVLYLLAALLTYPLTLYPTFATLETSIKSLRKMAPSARRTWVKNLLRSLLSLIAVGITLLASKQIEMFVSIIGSICAVPLGILLPSLIHLRIMSAPSVSDKEVKASASSESRSTSSYLGDKLLIILGLLLIPLTLSVNVYVMITGDKH